MANIEISDDILIPAKQAFEEYHGLKNMGDADFLQYLVRKEKIECENRIAIGKERDELDGLMEKYKQ